MRGKDVAGFLLTVAGAAGSVACLASLSSGMRDVMQTDGGTCASGGPYVIAHQCSSADIHLVMLGIFGGMLSAAVYAGGTAALGRRASSAGLLAWAALFGALGWNFISQGRHPAGQPGSATNLVVGGMFELMALGGLVVLLGSLASDLRGGGRRPVSSGLPPLVRAVVPAGMAAPGGPLGWQTGSAPAVAEPPARGAVLLRLGTWLLASLAGAGAGIVLGAGLISALR